MPERGAVPFVLAEIAIDDLAFEDIADEPTAITAAALNHHVPEAEIVERLVLVLAFEIDTVPLAPGAQDVESLEQQKAGIGMADHFENIAPVLDRGEQARPVRHDAPPMPDIGIDRDAQASRDLIGARRDDEEAARFAEGGIQSALQGGRIVRRTVADDAVLARRYHASWRLCDLRRCGEPCNRRHPERQAGSGRQHAAATENAWSH